VCILWNLCGRKTESKRVRDFVCVCVGFMRVCVCVKGREGGKERDRNNEKHREIACACVSECVGACA